MSEQHLQDETRPSSGHTVAGPSLFVAASVCGRTARNSTGADA